MIWTEIAVEVERETEDLVSSFFYDIGAKGLNIEDPFYLEDIEQSPMDWDYLDESLVDTRGKRIKVMAYFSEEERPEEKLDSLKELMEAHDEIDMSRHKISLRKLEEKDWAENWKKYYKPTRIGKKIIIKPSWEDYEKKDGEIIIEIDPGMAFGTGTHETTSMCTEALEKYLEEGEEVYDVGTGSGILSMVAAKLGAKSVLGIDFDPTAVKVAKDNVENLGLTDIVTIKEGNLLDLADEKADLIVANIMADIIINMTPDVKNYLKEDGIFISSGIILDKIDEVEAALVENGFELLETNKLNEWACIISRR